MDEKRQARQSEIRKRKQRYHRASIALGIIFIILALIFPIWLHTVRGIGEDTIFVEYLPPSPTEFESIKNVEPSQSLPGGPPPIRTINVECRNYVYERCSALKVKPGECAEIAFKAMKIPISGGLDLCKQEIDPDIARIYPNPQVISEDIIETKEQDALVKVTVDVIEETVSKKFVYEEPIKREDTSLSSQERIKNLIRARELIDLILRGAQNYATSPELQRQRFEELRGIVEKDGRPELKAIYNDLVEKVGRTGGYDLGKAQVSVVTSKPQEVKSVSPNTPPPKPPEIEMVDKMIGGGANLPTNQTEGPIRSVSPSDVPAPPSKSPY